MPTHMSKKVSFSQIFVQRCASSSSFFIQSLWVFNNFHKHPFFPPRNGSAWRWPNVL